MPKKKVWVWVPWLMVAAFAATGVGVANANGLMQTLAVDGCLWEGGGSPVYDWTGIYNVGSSAMTVECGIPSNDDAQSATHWSVAINDQHSSKSASCRFRVMDLWGNTIATSGSKQSSNGSHQISWAWTDPTRTDPATTGPIEGVTYVSCTIPPIQSGKRSGLNGVWVVKAF